MNINMTIYDKIWIKTADKVFFFHFPYSEAFSKSCSFIFLFCYVTFAGIKAKVGTHPFIKCASQFPLILWHPYARHHYFCVMTEKEQKKWHAVLQDCVRHSDNGNNNDLASA